MRSWRPMIESPGRSSIVVSKVFRGKKLPPSSALKPTPRRRGTAGLWLKHDYSSECDAPSVEEGFRLAGCEEQTAETKDEEAPVGSGSSGAGAEALCHGLSQSQASRLPS